MPHERTTADLGILQRWTSGIRFRDAEVNRLVDRTELCRVLLLHRCDCGEVIMTQGERGDSFYVVLEGSVTVYLADETTLAKKKRADAAALKPTKSDTRDATIGLSRTTPGSAVDERTQAEFRMLVATLRATEAETLGGPPADEKAVFAAKCSQWSMTRVVSIRESECFGDLALIFDLPRSATIVAEENTLLARIDRADFERCVKGAALNAIQHRAFFLSGLPAFSSFHVNQLVSFSSFFNRVTFAPGETLFDNVRGGSSSSEGYIYIVESGDASVQARSDAAGGYIQSILTLGVGSVVGALILPAANGVGKALLPRAVATTMCAVLKLERAELEQQTGRNALAKMAVHEANAWLARLEVPGPLRSRLLAREPEGAAAPVHPMRNGKAGGATWKGTEPSLSNLLRWLRVQVNILKGGHHLAVAAVDAELSPTPEHMAAKAVNDARRQAAARVAKFRKRSKHVGIAGLEGNDDAPHPPRNPPRAATTTPTQDRPDTAPQHRQGASTTIVVKPKHSPPQPGRRSPSAPPTSPSKGSPSNRASVESLAYQYKIGMPPAAAATLEKSDAWMARSEPLRRRKVYQPPAGGEAAATVDAKKRNAKQPLQGSVGAFPAGFRRSSSLPALGVASRALSPAQFSSAANLNLCTDPDSYALTSSAASLSVSMPAKPNGRWDGTRGGAGPRTRPKPLGSRPLFNHPPHPRLVSPHQLVPPGTPAQTPHEQHSQPPSDSQAVVVRLRRVDGHYQASVTVE